MSISLNREGVALNAEERNKRNENWTKLEGEIGGLGSASGEALADINLLKDETAKNTQGLTAVNGRVDNVVIEAGNAAYEQVVDAAKLNWKEPVNAFVDLATSYPQSVEGDAAQTISDGAVYRFDGTDWKKIQQIDAGPINEVDARLTAQLEETQDLLPNLANGKSILQIMNPYGNYQNIHPKVLYFENSLHGWKYWMAYTPYPNGSTIMENPAIAVSNNGIDWTVPDGFENKVLDEWNGISGAYNNDTHLIYRADLNRLEVWWRYTNPATSEVKLYRRTSVNGVSWNTRETMFTGSSSANDHLSPALIYEEGKYKMLSVNNIGGGVRTLNYSESVDGLSWGSRITANIENLNGLTPWHVDFIKVDNQYELALQAWDIGEDNNHSSLYYLTTLDLINFSEPVKIIAPSTLPKTFDDQGIYRSSLLKINDMYYVFYSGVDQRGKRAMSISYGKNIRALQGFSMDLTRFSELSLTKGVNVSTFKQSENVPNLIELLQGENRQRFGGLKLGNVIFDDGLVSGVTPQEGSVRYNGTSGRKEMELHTGSAWLPMNYKKILYAEKTAITDLVKDEFTTVNFESTLFLADGFTFSNGALNISAAALFKFTVGLQLTGVLEGDSVEVYIKRGTSNARTISRQKLTPDSSGSFFIGADGLVNISGTFPFSVGIKYTGAATAPKVTQYGAQNFLFVERV
ncbi:hypothetical protein ACQKDB_16110 [Planococcus kocurii]|uniref:hypothetical protein n=1 Tax=Planococcus kocurii TaxID=1374 RepID=UPI003D06FDAB